MVWKGASKLNQDWPKTCEHLIINNCPNFDYSKATRVSWSEDSKHLLSFDTVTIMQAVDIRVK